MVNDELEARLSELSDDAAVPDPDRSAAQRALFEVYADWLEGKGDLDVASALRALRQQDFIPVHLDVAAAPDEPPLPSRHDGFSDVTLPLELFVIDQLVPRSDPRPIEDRRDLSLTKESFDKRFAEQRIAVALDWRGASIHVRFGRLADFDLEPLATQLSSLGVAADDIEQALRALFQIESLRAAERSWRSLKWLLDRAPPPVRVTVVNGDSKELLEDFEDAATIVRSGAFRLINSHNHPGMRPSGAIVLGAKVPNDKNGHRLLRSLGEVARKKSLPLLATLDVDPGGPIQWPPSSGPLGRHVTLGSPSFLLRDAHPFEAAALEGTGSYLLAARMAIAFSQFWGGGGLSGSLPDVRLARPSSWVRSALAASRGFVELFARGPDAHLPFGVTAAPSPAGSRSLDLHVIGCRLGLQLQNLHYRRLYGRAASEADIRDPAHIAERLGAGLSARLLHPEAIGVSLVDARFEDPPTDDGRSFAGTLDVGLSLTLPSAIGASPVHHLERASIRFGF